MKTKKITQRFFVITEQHPETQQLKIFPDKREISEQEYHDWAVLLNQLSAYDGKKWGAIKGMTEKYGWVEGYATST